MKRLAMADGSKIEWTDATWNPITGCEIVSPGCKNCYAMRLAGTRLQHLPSRAGLTRDTKAGPVWNGETRFNEKWLDQPLRWRRPRLIFVCAHGDLFAESVPDEWIDRVFAVMALAPHHTFQVLTKRSARMRAYCSSDTMPGRIFHHAIGWGATGLISVEQAHDAADRISAWPLPNVWLGVSAEDQKWANERVPDLLQTPAAVRFVSAEPLLGPIDFTDVFPDVTASLNAFTGEGRHLLGMTDQTLGTLDWIIVGAESGRGARPMDNAWVEHIIAQCDVSKGTATFVKQLSGEGGRAIKDIERFPHNLRVRYMPEARSA